MPNRTIKGRAFRLRMIVVIRPERQEFLIAGGFGRQFFYTLLQLYLYCRCLIGPGDIGKNGNLSLSQMAKLNRQKLSPKAASPVNDRPLCYFCSDSPNRGSGHLTAIPDADSEPDSRKATRRSGDDRRHRGRSDARPAGCTTRSAMSPCMRWQVAARGVRTGGSPSPRPYHSRA